MYLSLMSKQFAAALTKSEKKKTTGLINIIVGYCQTPIFPNVTLLIGVQQTVYAVDLIVVFATKRNLRMAVVKIRDAFLIGCWFGQALESQQSIQQIPPP